MKESLQIMMVGDESASTRRIADELQRGSAQPTLRIVSNRADFLAAWEARPPDLVLAELSRPDFAGIEALQLLKKHAPEIPLIFLCRQLRKGEAGELLQLGATDYLLENDLERLNPAIQRAVREARAEAERKKNDAELAALKASWIHSSRYAGMVEGATTILHNLGNVLNSVFVSTSQITERLGNLPHGQVAEVARLLRAHEHSLSEFVSSEGRGPQLIAYLEQLAESLAQEHQSILQEIISLVANIEHINAVIATQQRYATHTGPSDAVDLPELIEDALRMHAVGLLRNGVEISREYSPLPPLAIERHKVLQILINLISNAKDALECSAGERRITLRVFRSRPSFMAISVADSGRGISPENLARIFELGFTTRAEGHGFGLPSSALAAREMGGTLTAFSNGPDSGATFTLELPLPDPLSDLTQP